MYCVVVTYCDGNLLICVLFCGLTFMVKMGKNYLKIYRYAIYFIIMHHKYEQLYIILCICYLLDIGLIAFTSFKYITVGYQTI